MFTNAPPTDEKSCRIQDMPYEQRPREKLAALGPAALNNDELMALFISTGTKGVSAIQIGRNLIRKYGSMGSLGNLSVSQLAKEKGLGLAKASKLAAAFELGARVAREELQSRPLETPQLIYSFFGPQMSHLAKEQVVVAVLDARLRHIGTEIVSVGTVNESSAHPREVLRPVITRGGYSFVLIHNHPSGDPSPSRADQIVTKTLVEAAKLMKIEMLDHLIIGRPAEGRLAYYSFREAGLVP
jgi:DNA repair protein RadC